MRELKDAPRAERVLAETSTFPLDAKISARQELEKAGIVMLDCPLSGSGSQALVRDVLVYASGAKDAYDRCLPVFQGFSRAPHYLGPFGNGSKMKYVANLLVAIHTAAAGEAFAMARKVGLDPAQMFEVVADGAAGSRALQVRGDMLIADSYTPIRTMPLELWRKDMQIIADFANSMPLPDADVLRRRASVQRSCRLGLRRPGHGRRLRRAGKDGRADLNWADRPRREALPSCRRRKSRLAGMHLAQSSGSAASPS